MCHKRSNNILPSKCRLFYWILHISYFASVFCVGQNEVASTTQTNNLHLTNNATTFNIDDNLYSYEEHNVNNVSCQGKVCVRKCCKSNLVFNISNHACVEKPSSNDTNLLVLVNEIISQINITNLIILYGFPPEQENNSSCYVHDYGFSLKPDGNAFHKFREETFSQKLYCIDEKLAISDGDEEALVSVLCYDLKEVSKSEIAIAKIRVAGLAISVISLIAILALHLLSNHRKSLQTKCLISSCISLLLSFIVQIIKMTSIVQNITDGTCFAMAGLLQFFSHSFHFWLNIMCYEISRVIRGTTNAVPLVKLEGTNRRYLCYAIYSWGVPMLTSVLLWGMIYLPKDLPRSIELYIIRPDIKLYGCWFKEAGVSYFLYHGGIEIFLQIMNGLLLGHAAMLLNWRKCTSLRCNKRTSILPVRTHCNFDFVAMFRQQFYIFIVFVFIWSLDYIALISLKNIYWKIVHMMIALQGAYLLIIVVTSNRCLLLYNAKETYCAFTKIMSNKLPMKIKLSSNTGSSSSNQETEETNL